MAKKKRELYVETACLHCNQKGRENIKTDCKVCGGSGWVRSNGWRSSQRKTGNSSLLLFAVLGFCIGWLIFHKDPAAANRHEPPPDTVYEKSYADSPQIETQNKTAPSRGQDEKEPELKVLLRELDRAIRD